MAGVNRKFSMTNKKILGLLGSALLVGTISANAQSETLQYSEGVFSGTVTLNTPLPENGHDFSVSPAEFNFAQLGYGAGYQYLCPTCGYTLGGMIEYGAASFSFSTSDGHISAWDITIDFTGTPGTNTQTSLYATISSSGNSFTEQTFGAACEPYPGHPDPCQPVRSSNKTRGVWTAISAPEIDPVSAGAALTLLCGGLCVLSGRRADAGKRSSH
jgi:hypothetical protein